MNTTKKKPKVQKRVERAINDRMRRVCELVVSGKPAGRAYELAGYAARGDVADQAASRLLGKVKVKEYLETLRADAAVKAEYTRDDLVGFLVEVIKTPVGNIGEKSPLAQKVRVDEAGGFLIEMPSKMQAAKQLAEVLGWNKPQEVKVDLSEKLADIIGRVRRS
jgi:hypothetical protein